MWNFDYQVIFNILFITIACYIILKHFLLSSKEKEEEQSIESIDRMVRQKESVLGGVPGQVRNTPPSFLEEPFLRELEGKLQWDHHRVHEDLREELGKLIGSKVHWEFSINVDKAYLERNAESKEVFLCSYFVDSFLLNIRKEFDFLIGKLNGGEFFFSSLFLFGMNAKLFTCFDGSLGSLKKIFLDTSFDTEYKRKLRAFFSADLLPKVEGTFREVEGLILLDREKIEQIFSKTRDKKTSFKKMSQIYHPDKINLKMIPQNKRESFEKIYTDQYSFINEEFSKN